MIPSRGLRLSIRALGIGRRRLDNNCARSFSTSRCNNHTSSTPLLLNTTALSSRAYRRYQIPQAGAILQHSLGIRFKSTTSLTSNDNSAIDTTSTTNANDLGPASDLQLEDALEFSSAAIKNIPEYIGYLKSIGIDYGFGPTSFVEWILEHIHILCGTPWWASIALTAVAFRLIFFKAFVAAADNGARINTVAHIAKPLQQKMSEASRAGNTQQALQLRRELQLVYKRAGIKLWKSMAPMLQAFIGYGTFILLRAMSNLPVPGLETGGILWFTDLTIPDPFFILPLATAGALHFVLRKGGETGSTNLSDSMARKLAYAFPGLSFIFTWWLPASIQLSFFITSLLSQLQAGLLRSTPFRQYMKIAPLPDKPGPFSAPKASPSPYQPRIVTVAEKATRGTYEAPRTASGPGSIPTPHPKPTLFSGISKEINSAVDTVKSTAESIKALAKDEKKIGKRTKAEIQAAKAYEEKRQREEAVRLAALDAERRARRKQRREQRQ